MPRPTLGPSALVRRSAVLAFLAVIIEAAFAAAGALVPAWTAIEPGLASWSLVAAPALVAGVGFLLLVGFTQPSRAVSVAAILLVVVGLGALMGALGTVAPSLRGAGLAFALPLVIGEMFAAGSWLAAGASSRGDRQEEAGLERRAAALSLLAASATTCAAAFFVGRLEVEMTALAIGIAGVCAHLQLAMARIGEGRLIDGDLVAGVAARFAAVPSALAVASLGRFEPQPRS